MKKLTALLLFVFMACGSPIRVNELIPHATGREYRLVVTGVAEFEDSFSPAWKQYYKIGDERMNGTIYTLLSEKRVCIVPMIVWAAKPFGTPVICDWRMPHSVNRSDSIFRS